MRFPSFATLLIALGASLLLAAFGETSSTPSSSATTTPSATITSPSDPTATATPRYLAPKTEAPAATDAPLQDATPVPPTFRAPIETPVSPVANNLVFYDQDGVTLEHY